MTTRSRGVSGRRLSRALRVLAALALGSAALAGCADGPPTMVTAGPGDGRAVVSWEAAPQIPGPVAYVVTAWSGGASAGRSRFESAETRQIVGGLTNGVEYTFTVTAISPLGNESAPSAPSDPVTPGPPLAADYELACALVADGGAKCWGQGALNPIAVPGLTGATALTAGDVHRCAVITGGEVQCWGSNFFGQLGDGTSTASATPVTAVGVSDAIAITATDTGTTCALIATGAVQCWGTGVGLTPANKAGISGATAIDAGIGHFCAVVAGGAVKCWGANDDGQLGDGTTTSLTTPVTVGGISGATAVTAGGLHTCVRLPGGTMKCWGRNDLGQLGGGFISGGESVPVSVAGLTGARVIAAGWMHTCAIVEGAAVRCWGDNTFGQVGDGTNNARSTPTPVPGMSDVIAITGGGYFTCANRSDLGIWCWGDNLYGQLGDGSEGGASYNPVAVVGL